MSQNIPFLYGGGQGQNAPSLPGLNLLQQVAPSASSMQSANAQNGVVALPEQDSFMTQHSSLLTALQALSPEQLRNLEGMLPSLQAAKQSSSSTIAKPIQPTQIAPAVVPPAVLRESSSGPDVDKEDGEVDETEELETAAATPEIRPIPTGPRSMQPPMYKKQKIDHYGERSQTPQYLVNGRIGQSSITDQSDRKTWTLKKSQVEMFLEETVHAGYSYQDLVEQGVDGRLLKPIFDDLRLPIHSKPAIKSNEITTNRFNTNGQSQALQSSIQPRNSEPTKISTPKTNASAPSRAEYLARLQAAKSKKPALSPGQNTAAESENTRTVVEPTSTSSTPATQPVPSTIHTATPTTKANAIKGKTVDREALNAKLRERLEKMRNAQAAKQSTTPVGGEIAGQSNHVELPAVQPTSASVDQTLHRTASAQSILPTSTQAISSSITPSQTATHPTTQPRSTFSPSATTTVNRSFTLPGLFLSNTSTPLSDPSVQLHTSATTFANGERDAPTTGYFDQTALDDISGSDSSKAALQIQRDAHKEPSSHDTSTKPKKRAVAADFDSSPDVVKRPFGQSRPGSTDEEMIIEVSDDSDDSDDNGPLYKSVETHKDYHSSSSQLSRQYPYDNVPSPLGPSGALTPGGLDYQRKMAEIEEMKRRLADAELRRKGRASATLAMPLAHPKDTSSVMNAAESSPTGPLQDTQPSQILRVDAQDTSVQQPNTHLSSSKEQEKTWLKQRLAELERSRVESNVQLTPAAKNSDAPTATTSNLLAEPSLSTSTVAGPNTLSTLKEDSDIAMVENPAMEQSEEGELEDMSDRGRVSFDDPPTTAASTIDSSEKAPPAASQIQTNPIVNDQEEQPDPMHGLSSNTAIQTHQRESSVHVSNSPETSGLDGSDLESSLQRQAHQDIQDSDQESQAMEESSDSESDKSSDDSNASSEEEQDYQAEQINVAPKAAAPDHVSVHAEDGFVSHVSSSSMDEDDSSNTSSDDSYEPSPQPQVEQNIQEAVPDAEESQDDDDYEPYAQVTLTGSADTTSTSRLHETIDDADLAPEIQPDGDQRRPVCSSHSDRPTDVRFEPYHSPLEHFKDFRYHPKYASVVPGGFKSLTYNHRIDPDNPICPYEASGGLCNNADCVFQHFANMGFTDNELIRILGTEYGNHHEEVRNEFNRGLAAIVNELKASSLSRDVNAIAQRIVDFRRGFLGDPSRVLDFEWWNKKYGSHESKEVES